MKLAGKTIVVTGGASGIGRALALECAHRGASIALADVNLDGALETKALVKAQHGADAQCSAYQLDVTDLPAWQAFRDQVINEHDVVDGIINNAGLTFTGTAEDMSYEQLGRIMSVNFMGMVYGSKEFLPTLKTRPEAFIANVSSVLGLYPIKNQAAYCASKYAIRGFTEVLAQELKSSRVLVSTIHPGHIGTDILQNALDHGNIVGAKLSAQEAQGFVYAFKAMGLSPARAATIIVDGLQKRKSKILVGRDAQRGDILSRLFPKLFVGTVNKAAP